MDGMMKASMMPSVNYSKRHKCCFIVIASDQRERGNLAAFGIASVTSFLRKCTLFNAFVLDSRERPVHVVHDSPGCVRTVDRKGGPSDREAGTCKPKVEPTTNHRLHGREADCNLKKASAHRRPIPDAPNTCR